MELLIILFCVYIAISLFILPFQYRLLVSLKAHENTVRAEGNIQSKMYDDMNAGEFMLHSNAQGNPIFFFSNILATLLVKYRETR
ncbi:hypothetical protein Q73_14150 [Bacillus coahuilensis m2-6]|uniref:DUF3949 domain-containing protein n=1 Tax=Bacillus coahuilensis TaxID=408580 RepID=UPI0007505364|nr:DUF3949 domain-containing protein [Bacillus coahuilensis]KUP04976.1 hypothetical protein Q73_14150 [Bacillus coahuilensis m2-6]